MCLLIVWLNPEKTEEVPQAPGLSPRAYPLHEYSLILASNRDERYDRPSLASQFAKREEKEDDILGGWDATPGKEGGTWLGLSLKRAKIGALVNIPEPNPKGTKGRGCLVTDFLGSAFSAIEYCEEKGLTGAGASEYPGFQFITLEGRKTPDAEGKTPKTNVSTSAEATATTAPDNAAASSAATSHVVEWRLNYTSNRSSSFSASTNKRRDPPNAFDRFTHDVFVFSNSPVQRPLLKIADVEARFRKDVLAATTASIAAAAAEEAKYYDLRGYDCRDCGYIERANGGGRGRGSAIFGVGRNGSRVGSGSGVGVGFGVGVAGTGAGLDGAVAAGAEASKRDLDDPANSNETYAALSLIDEESALMDALFRILSCRREYDNDHELAARIDPNNFKGNVTMSDDEVTMKLSAVFNATPVFGTRTQTVLLLKWDGSAVWREKTMKEPIDATLPEWEERTYRVKF